MTRAACEETSEPGDFPGSADELCRDRHEAASAMPCREFVTPATPKSNPATEAA